MPRRHVLLATAVAIGWGANFVAIDVGLRSLPPFLFVAVRFALVAFPAVFFLPRPPIALRYVLGVGLLLSAGQFALLFTSIHLGMPAGLASLVLQLQAVFTVGLAVALLGERPGRRQLVGAAVALGGIAIIGIGRTGPHLPLGALLLCVAAAASWGAGNVVVRVARAPNSMALMAWSSLVPPLPLLAMSLAFEGPRRIVDALGSVSLEGVAAVLYVVVIATGFGYSSWSWLLRLHPASKVAPFSLLVPVIGIGSAWAALGEQPGVVEIVGATVVLCGLGLVTASLRVPARRARAAPVPAPAEP
jgi:O-acetylserine/cysteine efflux transporter